MVRWAALSFSELASRRVDNMTQEGVSASVLLMIVSVFELN